MGRVTRFHYGSSGDEQRRDADAGRAWSLPAHREVVKKIEVIDTATGERSARTFDYHDGHYDGVERRFVGFGQVDETDVDVEALAPESQTTPTVTRRFYHNGDESYAESPHRFAAGPASSLSELSWPDADHIHAHRALAGKLVAMEVFAHGSSTPMRVEESAYRVELLRAADEDHPRGAFRVLTTETRETVLEQRTDDPRIVRRLALEHDEYGYVRVSAELALPRRNPALAAQGRVHATLTNTRLAHIDTHEHFHLGLPVEETQFELELASSDSPIETAPRRMISRRRTLYWNEARTAAVPLGEVAIPALVHHVEEAAFDREMLAGFDRFGDTSVLATGLGYHPEGAIWVRAGPVSHYGMFGLLERIERPDGERRFEYAHRLVLSAVVDELGHRTEADIDPHLLVPWRIRDANGTVREARYDARGVAVRTSAYGTLESADYGHEPVGSEAPASFDDALRDPEAALGGAASVYAYELGPTPRAIVITAERFAHQDTQRARVEITYFDAFGRVIQQKQQLDADRWRASGVLTYDEKQRVVREHEPFFTSTSALERREHGVASTLRYDALDRIVREDFPNGTYARTEHEPWSVVTYDANDTVSAAVMYRDARQELDRDHPERIALDHALSHADTPNVAHLDPFGRVVATDALADDRRVLRTVTDLDARGDPIRVVDPRLIESFVYVRDLCGRVIHERSADAGERWTLPDAFDRPSHEWTPRGVHRARAFDALDRLTEVRIEHEGRRWTAERLTYDLGDNARGRLIRHEDGAGIVRMERYDPFGNVLARTRQLTTEMDEPDWDADVSLEPELHRSRLEHDALGRVVREELPDRSTRHRRYAPSGALDEVIVEADGVARTVLAGSELNARDQEIARTLGNGLLVRTEYHPETFLPAHRYAERNGLRIQDLEHAYDPSGRLVHSIDRAQEPGRTAVLRGQTVGPERRYAYDFRYHLVFATGRVHGALGAVDYRRDFLVADTFRGTRRASLSDGGRIARYVRRYAYDDGGNLRWIDHRTLDGGTGTHWLLEKSISRRSNRALPRYDFNGIEVTDPEPFFDAAGNCEHVPGIQALEWSADGRLLHAVVVERDGDPDEERYQYAADARRVRKRSRALRDGVYETTDVIYLDGCEIKRVRQGDDEILSSVTSHIEDADGTKIATLYRWKRDALARETSDVEHARLHYVLHDQQNSAVLELDEDLQFLSYEEYFPYGVTAFVAGDPVREVALRTIRYAGKEQDDATGFYYFQYRYYAPFIGNWLSPDPAGAIDSQNLYEFVRGDPINLTDDDGRQAHRTRLSGYDPRTNTSGGEDSGAAAATNPQRTDQTGASRSGVIELDPVTILGRVPGHRHHGEPSTDPAPDASARHASQPAGSTPSTGAERRDPVRDDQLTAVDRLLHQAPQARNLRYEPESGRLLHVTVDPNPPPGGVHMAFTEVVPFSGEELTQALRAAPGPSPSQRARIPLRILLDPSSIAEGGPSGGARITMLPQTARSTPHDEQVIAERMAYRLGRLHREAEAFAAAANYVIENIRVVGQQEIPPSEPSLMPLPSRFVWRGYTERTVRSRMEPLIEAGAVERRARRYYPAIREQFIRSPYGAYPDLVSAFDRGYRAVLRAHSQEQLMTDLHQGMLLLTAAIPIGEAGLAARGGGSTLASVIRTLRGLGLSSPQRRAFLEGGWVAFEMPVGEGSQVCAVGIEGTRLRFAIVGNYLGVEQGARAFLATYRRAQQLAAQLGLDEVEIMGVAFNNAELRQRLIERGFSPGTFNVPAELGGGTTEGVSRVFRTGERFPRR